MSAGKVKKSGRQTGVKFYTKAVTDAERVRLPGRADDLADEIALLRVKLFTAVDDHPEDLRLMKIGIDALVRAVAAQYRMSPKAQHDLSDSLAAMVRGIGDQLIAPDR